MSLLESLGFNTNKGYIHIKEEEEVILKGAEWLNFLSFFFFFSEHFLAWNQFYAILNMLFDNSCRAWTRLTQF